MKRQRRKFLAFDLGASSGRAVVGTLAGGRLALEEIHRFTNAPVDMRGTLFWDFPALWREVREALRLCAARGHAALDGIGIDTWGVDFGLLGRDGRLNGNPFCYRDAITEGMDAVIAGKMAPEKLYTLTGMTLGRVGTLPQLVGLGRERGGARLQQAETLLMMPDLFRYFLCGHRGVERTIAGSSFLTNVRTGAWCGPVLKAFGLPRRMLPPIIPTGTVVGRLNAGLAKASGLNRAPVVAVAGHDTLSAAAAAPVADAGTVFLSTGTWSVIGVERPDPVTSAEAMRRGFVNELGVHGVLFARNLIGLYLFENLKRSLAREGKALTYATMIQAARAARPFACRLDVSAPEFFVTDDPRAAIRTYLKRTRQKPVRTWPEAARAILEGLAWSYRSATRDLATLTGTSFRRISMVGGGTHNRLLCGMAADATGLDVMAGPAEATVIGNIGLQATATGALKDAEAIRVLARRSFEVKRYRPRDAAAWDEAERRRGIRG
jgi:rhamnulokinase/L-fuculokinase